MRADDNQSEEPKRKPLLGIAKGIFEVPDDIDEDNEEIGRRFEESEISPPEPSATDDR
jgi:hypothetical protein